jgi:integrase
MSVYKRGKVWAFVVSLPGATRKDRRQETRSGFKSKGEAKTAETAALAEAQRNYEIAQARALVAAGIDIPTETPKTLGALAGAFLKYCAMRVEAGTISPKTEERYRENIAYVSPQLLATDLYNPPISPLHFTCEWTRLHVSGGRDRKTGTPRPMSAKSVRHVANTVSSAFSWAIRYGYWTKENPVKNSEKPRVEKKKGAALSTAQVDLLVAAAAVSPALFGQMAALLQMNADDGERRGEILALRWADIDDQGVLTISRSLCQTSREMETANGPKKVHDVLTFKSTKTNRIRTLPLTGEVRATLRAHRERQLERRAYFGGKYRADLDLIFCQPDGEPLMPDSVSSAVSALFKRLKLPKPKGAALHLLRHTHGSHLLASGTPVTDVAERLGHSSPRVTLEIYSHQIQGQDRRAVSRYEEFKRRERAAAHEGPEQVQ